MKKNIRLISLIVLGFLPVVFSNAQTRVYENLTFEHLSIEDGLSQITVHSILKDSRGFLWFGTEDGLNRFDGYSFVIYRYDPSDSNSISDNFIWTIFEDSDANLWIGTNNGGLNLYNYQTDNFSNYLTNNLKEFSSTENNVRKIVEYQKGKLLLGTNSSGLFSFDVNSKQFNEVLFSGNSTINITSIRSIEIDNKENIWIGTEGEGLIKLDQNLNLDKLLLSGNKNTISSNIVWALESNDEKLFIGTYGGGLNTLNLETDRIIQFPATELLSENVTDLRLDSSERLWIATENGLSILNSSTNKIINYQNNLSDFKSLSNNFTRSIFLDDNLVWIGTVGGGINKINTNKKFSYYNHNPSDPTSLSNNMIRAISEDMFGNIWVGTLGKGLNRFDKTENKFQHYNSVNFDNINFGDISITSILEDNNKNLLVGTWGGGLFKFKPKTKNKRINKISNISESSGQNSISSNIVQTIFQDSKKLIWIGTENGLDVFDENLKKIIHFENEDSSNKSISDNRVQSKSILEDRFGNIWIGTWKGLNRISFNFYDNVFTLKSIDKFYHGTNDLSTLTDNRVISLYEDKNTKGDSLILWVGTIGGGLNQLIFESVNNISEYTINHFTEKDGLANNVVYGILDDEENNIWLSTNNGLSKLNIKTNSFTNFDTRDGLQSNQFFWGAYHKAKDGTLYFGGINGLNSFMPNDLVENEKAPKVYITNCSITPIDSKNAKRIINWNSFSEIETISLPYNQYKIDFEFAALDFTIPEKNNYIYYFQNYDETKSNSQNQNTVSYTNVTEGNYTFTVIGSNNDGVWNKQGASVNIVIETPYWKTWWFILIIAITITALIIYFVLTQVKNLLAVERLRTKLAADLHDNIGSSLTEISILSEVINTRLRDADEDIVKNLNKISVKSRYLIDKMSDIVWLVNPQRDSLYDLILRLQDTYSELLADTSISFRSENLKSLEKVSLSMEHRQHLFLVFKEAINNSINHSKCKEIILNAKVDGKRLEMILKDNGEGFDTGDDSYGNGLANMKRRSKKIGGKLIITSGIGKGTIVKYIGYIS